VIVVIRHLLMFGTSCFACFLTPLSMADEGRVVLQVTGNDGTPLPCRIHIADETGKPRLADGLPAWRNHFCCGGNAALNLEYQSYTFLVERGPEYTSVSGEFQVSAALPTQTINVRLEHMTDMPAAGWYAGDLHIHRRVEDIELLMQAEDLHVGPVITWWNKHNRWQDRPLPQDLMLQINGRHFCDLMAGEDERTGGALLYFNLPRPLPITKAESEYPSPLTFVELARKHPNVWIDVEKPFWWDMPVWVASGKINSIGLANNHMCHSRMYEDEAWGRPRDAQRLPAPLGNGYWSQEIYYHLLNCGLRIPPSAGSASGVLPNPVGYNRVYVFTGNDFKTDDWWEGLKAGRSFVTNGPLLVARAGGQLPGHVFSSGADDNVEIEIDVSLTTKDDISDIEIIRDGHVVQRVPLQELNQTGEHTTTGRLATVRFEKSGWFLLRTIARHPRTFRFASTAPWYVEVGEKTRQVNQESAQFFLDWVEERIERVTDGLKDPEKLQQVLRPHFDARDYWAEKVAEAKAE